MTVRAYDVMHATGPIAANGQPVPVLLATPGQNALLTFQGVQGQMVSASLFPVSPATLTGYWYLRILTADGTPLASSCSCTNVYGFLDTVILPADGTYTEAV